MSMERFYVKQELAMEPRVPPLTRYATGSVDIGHALLNGYKNLEDGAIDLVLPRGLDFLELASSLNLLSASKELPPVIAPGDFAKWQSMPGFSQSPSYSERVRLLCLSEDPKVNNKYGVSTVPMPAALTAIALAEACERLCTNGERSLFTYGGRQVWAKGPYGDYVLSSNRDLGVRLEWTGEAFRYFCPSNNFVRVESKPL